MFGFETFLVSYIHIITSELWMHLNHFSISLPLFNALCLTLLFLIFSISIYLSSLYFYRKIMRPNVNYMDEIVGMACNTSPTPSIENVPMPIPSCHMCEQSVKSIPRSISDESGIQLNDFQEEDIDVGLDDPEMDLENDGSRPVSKVEIKHLQVHDGPLNIVDILSHGEMQALGDCMVKLMEHFPSKKARQMYELSGDVVSLGLKQRRIRQNRRVIGNVVRPPQYRHNSHSAPLPQNSETNKTQNITKKDGLTQQFPMRKPSTRVATSRTMGPIECGCRKTCGPFLNVQGKQAPIFMKVPTSDMY